MKDFALVKEGCLRDFLPNKRGFASEKGLSSIDSIKR